MNPEYCPCCAKRNQCSQATTNEPVQDCWCFHVDLDAQRLERLPEQLRNRACLCPRCAQMFATENP